MISGLPIGIAFFDVDQSFDLGYLIEHVLNEMHLRRLTAGKV
jgi:hypothetical protein